MDLLYRCKSKRGSLPIRFQMMYFTKEVSWMKQSGRKWLGILLAASIVAATVFPMQGTAAEGIDRGAESEMQ